MFLLRTQKIIIILHIRNKIEIDTIIEYELTTTVLLKKNVKCVSLIGCMRHII